MTHHHQDERIRQIFLEMLFWDIKKHLIQGQIDCPENFDQVAHLAVMTMASDDLDTVERASQIIHYLISQNHTIYLSILARQGWERWNIQETHARTVLLRYYALVSSLVQAKEDLMNEADRLGFLDRLFALCRYDDILAQVNAIEMLPNIGTTNVGLNALNRLGVIRWLITMGCGGDGEEPHAFLQEDALRALSSIFHHAGEKSILFVEQVDPGSVTIFLKTVRQRLEEGDEVARVSSLAVLADFMSISAFSLEKVILLDGGKLVEAWFHLLHVSKPELQGAVLQALARVLFQSDATYISHEAPSTSSLTNTTSSNAPEGSVESVDPNVQLDKVRRMKQTLIGKLQAAKQRIGGAVSYLLHCVKQPIHSIRYPAIEVMTALVSQPTGWGLQLLLQSASTEPAILEGDFWLYLSDRSTENTKEGKDFKFALILAFQRHPLAVHLPGEVKRLLNQMVQQGAYYKPAAMGEMQTL